MDLTVLTWCICIQGADSLRPLLEEAAKYIPQSKWRDTPIALKATAGLRMLSNDTAAQILEKVLIKFTVLVNMLIAVGCLLLVLQFSSVSLIAD